MIPTDPAATPRYLVAWGGDKRSQDALVLGAVLASTFAAELHVLYVVHEESVLSVQHAGERSFRDRVEEQATARLQRALEVVPSTLSVTTHVRRSTSVTQAILASVAELDAALLVVGGGSAAGGGMIVNPTAAGLLHVSPVPVAMAPRGYRSTTVAPVDELVAAVGTRPGAQDVVEEAVEGVRRVGLPLRLVSLVGMDHGKRPRADAARRAETVLAEASERLAGRCSVTTEVGQGKNLKQAVRRIDWNPRSVLMVGSSRLAQGRQTFLGSTAAHMLAHLPVPLVVVPRRD